MSALSLVDMFVVVLCDILDERVSVCVCVLGSVGHTRDNHTVCRSLQAG